MRIPEHVLYEQQIDDDRIYNEEIKNAEWKAHEENQNKKQMVKTAKVNRVNQVKPWNGSNGTVYYCQCEMDNGDKIEIGKKKEVQEGWELTYQITDTQQEYNKAKAAKLDNFQGGGFAKTDNTKGIKIGHAITNAVSLVCANGIGHAPNEKEAIKMYAKMIYELSDELNNEL